VPRASAAGSHRPLQEGLRILPSTRLARIIHDSFCCKLAFLAPRGVRPRCSLRRTVSAPRCAAPGASAIRFGNRAFATKSRE
jgi:hypothetical protein